MRHPIANCELRIAKHQRSEIGGQRSVLGRFRSIRRGKMPSGACGTVTRRHRGPDDFGISNCDSIPLLTAHCSLVTHHLLGFPLSK